MTDLGRDKPIGSMIESIVRTELINELQAISGQQNKQLAEKKEKRMKAIKDEVKRLHLMAVRLDKELEQELNNLSPITNVQSEHGAVCAEIIRNAGNLNNKYSEWMAAHERRFKTLIRTSEDMGELIVDEEQPDENQKVIKSLLISAESKYLLMEGKRETIGLADADLDVIRQEIGKVQEEYDKLSE